MNPRSGFTLIELIIVLAIGGIVTGIVVMGFGGLQTRTSVRSAQTNFLSMHAQTRAMAVERGIAMRLTVHSDGGVVRIEEGCDGAGDVVQSRDFGGSYNVTIQASGGELWLCMTPRGYAEASRNSFAQEARISFVRGDQVASVVLFPLGQAVRP